MNIQYYSSDGRIHFLGDDYLSHHGVLGMKWGVRNDPRKSLDRLYKMDQKSNQALVENGKLLAKSARKRKKANKMMAKAIRTGEEKYSKKAMRLNKKADKLQGKAGKTMYKGIVGDKAPSPFKPSFSQANRKAAKYAAKINKKYGSVPVSGLSQNQVYVGRKYAIDFVR